MHPVLVSTDAHQRCSTINKQLHIKSNKHPNKGTSGIQFCTVLETTNHISMMCNVTASDRSTAISTRGMSMQMAALSNSRIMLLLLLHFYCGDDLPAISVSCLLYSSASCSFLRSCSLNCSACRCACSNCCRSNWLLNCVAVTTFTFFMAGSPLPLSAAKSSCAFSGQFQLSGGESIICYLTQKLCW